MLFSSLSFIFRFLPVFLIIYLLVPSKLKNAVLFFGSLIFYAFGEPGYVVLMFFTVLVNYCLARYMTFLRDNDSESKFLITIAIVYNIGVLVFFKYTAFILENISAIFGVKIGHWNMPLPLGISFYTFQVISYCIDVYRGEYRAEKKFIDFGAYLTMFPQLIAGPIVTFDAVKDRLRNKKEFINVRYFEDGLRIFTLGLASKVLLANRFGQLWEGMDEAGYAALSTHMAWLGIAAYTLQIYFDFNGYSMMAIGLGKMLGFDIPRNFNHPYTAYSVTDFWKRWHITLTSFFRKYIYIPLGGNRKGKFRTLINMLIVWLLTGIWHGAGWNFILWGLYYFIILAVERIFLNKLLQINIFTRIAGHIYTLMAVAFGWAIFAITEIDDVFVYMSRLAAPVFKIPMDGYGPQITVVTYIWLFIGMVLSTPFLAGIYDKLKKSPIVTVILLALFWCSVVQLVDSVYNPFLYFRF